MITIDNRLKACAAYVSGTGVVCDVGTDHAYLPAYLALTGRCGGYRIIASDRNSGPLKAAAHTLEKYEVQEQISLIQSDGLQGISGEGISDVIIAGMGAELICEILQGADWLKNGVNLILQPMTKVALLRYWLYDHGFEILSETAVACDRFLYTVMKAAYSGKTREISEVEAHIGKIDLCCETGRAYAKKQAYRLWKAGQGVSRSISIQKGIQESNKKVEQSLQKITESCLRQEERVFPKKVDNHYLHTSRQIMRMVEKAEGTQC